MDRESCIICFGDVDKPNDQVRCTNVQCRSVTCVECVKHYISSISPEGGSLKCARTECSGLIDAESMHGKPGFSKEDLEAYYEGLLKNVSSSEIEGSPIRKEHAHQQAIKDVRAARQKFYNTFLPPAVLAVVNVAFAKKKNNVDARSLARQQERIADCTKRTCLNDFCDGLLDKNHRCSKCDSSFCKQCEHQLLEDQKHTCDEKDKESVAFIKEKLTACPKCGVRVEKAEGCMAITCAVCRTNFFWDTGKQGGGGNHGQSEPVVLQAPYTPPSVEFAGQLRGAALREILNLEENVASDLVKQRHDKMTRCAVAAEGDRKRLKVFAEAHSAYVRQKSLFQDSMKRLLSIRRVLAHDQSLVISDSLSDALKAFNTEMSLKTPQQNKRKMEAEGVRPSRLVRREEGAAAASREIKEEEEEEVETEIETEIEEEEVETEIETEIEEE